MEGDQYLDINRTLWNKRTEAHLGSDFYDVKSFKQGENSLKEIELNLLGDVRNKTLLHLQCHFGLDTLSLARMGAKVTGMDLSDRAIEAARALSRETGLEGDFVCCDIYDLQKNLNEKFDLLFTTYGTIGWLPDLNKWGEIISSFLKPGGKFVFADFHPVIWMFDDDLDKVKYNYFNEGPIIENESGSYADAKSEINLKSVGWNHAIDEVFEGLTSNGLKITGFREYNYSPYNVFKNMNEVAKGRYQSAKHDNKIPMVYSIVASK